ncbi:MAG TPA: hypothetical protein VFL82_06620, partial [Thermomicrobiales bacterium]|nr:hypothetical protein [Thermomicrobiales bacterium]
MTTIDVPRRIETQRALTWQRWRQEGYLFGFLMTVPTLIAVLAVMGYPWVYSAWLSLNRINPLLRTWHFVGLANYTDLARSSDLTN